MTIRLEPAPLADCDRARGFLQSGFWARFKSRYGWTPLSFSLAVEGADLGRPFATPLLVLVRRMGPGLSFAYVPRGPELELPPSCRAAVLDALGAALKPHVPHTCMFVRFDLPWFFAEERGPEADEPASEARGKGVTPVPKRPELGLPLVRASVDVQPPDTVLLDLMRDEAAIFAAMKPKWRYNARLAEKKGVVVECLSGAAAASALPEFYRLYKATAARDRIALHPEAYYAALFDTATQAESATQDGTAVPDLRLWIARHEGEALAAIVTLFRGGEAVYLYGASSDSKRNLMPAYALQWAAIRAAKASGCSVYDFYGIPPVDDPTHPMAGLYRFKTGFGGTVVHYAGSWDRPLKRIPYRLFRFAEAARAWYFKDFRKRRGRRL